MNKYPECGKCKKCQRKKEKPIIFKTALLKKANIIYRIKNLNDERDFTVKMTTKGSRVVYMEIKENE